MSVGLTSFDLQPSEEGIVTLKVVGYILDQGEADQFSQILQDLTEALVLLDLSSLVSLSNAGYWALENFRKKLQKGKLAMINVPMHIREVFHVTGMLVVFPIAETEEEARRILLAE